MGASLDRELSAMLARLSLRSLALWSFYAVRPCLDMLSRQRVWQFKLKRVSNLARKTLREMVDGSVLGLAPRIHEVARISESITTRKGKPALAGEAVYALFSQLGVILELQEEEEGRLEEKYYDPIAGSLTMVAKVVGINPVDYTRRFESIASLLLTRCGSGADSFKSGPAISADIETEIEKALG